MQIIITKDEIDNMGESFDMDINDEFLELIYNKRYADSICVKCLSEEKMRRVKNRKSYQCPSCGHQVYPLKGTIFEKTTIDFTWWTIMIRDIMSNPKVKITELWSWAWNSPTDKPDFTYKTAWRMYHLIKPNVVVGDFALIIKQ